MKAYAKEMLFLFLSLINIEISTNNVIKPLQS